MIDTARLHSAYFIARDALLAERVPAGHWVGELSTSALSTATAVMAFHTANPFAHRELIDNGIRWLVEHQNTDGGWGDTVKSFSNISTTMLCRAALELTGATREQPATLERVEEYLVSHAGKMPASRAAAIRRRYGKDHTFSVPILMTCAIAGLVPWDEVPRLPFEAAYLPQSWYRFVKMPVVSYALPALIAIGQCVHAHRRSLNPFRNIVRRITRGRTLRVLRRIQPTSGGYLEATPLTSFVLMALCSIRRRRSLAEQEVIDEGLRFLANSVRPDGSWPIDTNLATWVTTLSVNALAAAGDLESLDSKEQILDWLLKQQYKERHPYTGADPGGWAWTDLPGGVPDCDDTPGAMIAIMNLKKERLPEILGARSWVTSIQNSDAGFPTFCRGWGTLPFDRSGSDLTAHAIRCLHLEWENEVSEYIFTDIRLHEIDRTPQGRLASAISDVIYRGFEYLERQQQPDGSWLPLWFGNQHVQDDINPVYGTSRVLAAYRDVKPIARPEYKLGVTYLLGVQNNDGGWGGAKSCPSSVEETALAVEVLIDLIERGDEDEDLRSRKRLQVERGLLWLVEAVESGRFREPSPIGFYFAKLWYFEKLYPLIFTVAALGRARKSLSR